MKLEDCVNLETDKSITLASWIAGTNDYPERVENYQMRVKILEEMKQRAKKKPGPVEYSLASACAGLMKDDEGKKQLKADYAKSGLPGRIFTAVEDYIPVKQAAVYLRAKMGNREINRKIRQYNRKMMETLSLLPERYRPAEPTLESVIDATGKWIEDMRKKTEEMRKEMGERIKEDVKWLPEEYRPSVLTLETYVEASERYMKEKPDEYIARVRERAKSGK